MRYFQKEIKLSNGAYPSKNLNFSVHSLLEKYEYFLFQFHEAANIGKLENKESSYSVIEYIHTHTQTRNFQTCTINGN